MNNYTRQEKKTLEYICDTLTMYNKNFMVHMFSLNDSVERYKLIINHYKAIRKALVAVSPKFFNGVTMSNDFAIHMTGFKSIAIECKERTTSTFSPTELNKEILIRENKIIESNMLFYLDGSYTYVKKNNLSEIKMPKNYNIIYDIEQLKLF